MKKLGGISRTEFLHNYWQKKPLLIRQAFPGYACPISADELAGLACEEAIQSRMVLEKDGECPWELRHGPFKAEDFAALPATHWTLLVQAVDHHVPEITGLLDEFDFIPNWRIDDVMISYAPEHGSVGPHLDSYDVFLLQAHGRRHWHINEDSYTEDDFIEGPALRVLEEFSPQQDWVLEPGDMLYLPPGVAHHGIALDDCLTISIGFRAPSQSELLSAYTHHFDQVARPVYYSDPELELQESCGEIKPADVDKVRQMLLASITDDDKFARWFGRFITEDPVEGDGYEADGMTADDFHQALKQIGYLNRPGNIRFSYMQGKDAIRFYYAGNELSLPLSQVKLVQYLCAHHCIEYEALQGMDHEAAIMKLLFKLYCEGCLYFDE